MSLHAFVHRFFGVAATNPPASSAVPACRICGGPGRYLGHRASFNAQCLSCGWFYTVHSLSFAFSLRDVEQYAFFPGGLHLCKRIGIGNGSIACGIAELDAEQWPRRRVA